MISERECFVYIVPPGATSFVTAARFAVTNTKDGYPIGKFIYGKTYLARPDAVPFDPVELVLSDAPYDTVRMEGFFGAIRDGMPDFWGRRVMQRATHPEPLEEFDYLMRGPDDRAGALGFGLGVVPPAPRSQFNRTLDLEALQGMAAAVANDEPVQGGTAADAGQVKALLLDGTSMGGARPKAVVEDDDSLWIAKFAVPGDVWSQPRVEHALLNLAKQCGLNASDSKVVQVAGRDVLLVRRFDRDKTDGGYRRHHMVSALTLLQSEASPAARENWSYLMLADEVRRASARPADDLRELFGRVCFNALVSNQDDHPRNHALLAKDRTWRLSPAYDLTPTRSISKESRFLAMVCGVQGRIARRENLLSQPGRFMLSTEQAAALLDRMVETVRSESNNCLRRAGVAEADCARIGNAFVYEGFFYLRENP